MPIDTVANFISSFKPAASPQIGREGEIAVLLELQKQIKKKTGAGPFLSKYSYISYYNGKGPDIIFVKANSNSAAGTIVNKVKNGKIGNGNSTGLTYKDYFSIEVKTSNLKQDYVNKNINNRCSRKASDKPVIFGNGVKAHNIHNTGWLMADILVFVCKIDFSVKSIDKRIREEGGGCKQPKPIYHFWVFDRQDINKLHPKAALFIPVFVPTIMISQSCTPFTDQFLTLSSSFYQLLLPPFDYQQFIDDCKAGSLKNEDAYYSCFTSLFTIAWDANIRCKLVETEHRELADLYCLGGKQNFKHFINSWGKLSNAFRPKSGEKSGKDWKTILKTYRCEFEQPKTKGCIDCKNAVAGWRFK